MVIPTAFKKSHNTLNSTLLLDDLLAEGITHFQNFTIMSEKDFIFLLSAVKSKIIKQDMRIPTCDRALVSKNDSSMKTQNHVTDKNSKFRF